MEDLNEREGFAALGLRLLILTACRSGEVRGARWDEIDLDAGVWTIPAERMKAGKEHRAPPSGLGRAHTRHESPTVASEKSQDCQMAHHGMSDSPVGMVKPFFDFLKTRSNALWCRVACLMLCTYQNAPYRSPAAIFWVIAAPLASSRGTASAELNARASNFLLFLLLFSLLFSSLLL